MAHSKQFLSTAVLVLVMAVTGSMAQCSFNLTQSADEVSTRIMVGHQEVVIKRGYEGVWLGMVVTPDTYTSSDQSGRSETHSFNEVSSEDAAAYRNPVQGIAMDGFKLGLNTTMSDEIYVGNVAGDYLLEKVNEDGTIDSQGKGFSTFSELPAPALKEVSQLSAGVLETSTPNRSEFYKKDLFAILNADQSTGLSHIFFLLPSGQNSPVVVIDKECSNVKIVPYDQLDASLTSQ